MNRTPDQSFWCRLGYSLQVLTHVRKTAFTSSKWNKLVSIKLGWQPKVLVRNLPLICSDYFGKLRNPASGLRCTFDQQLSPIYRLSPQYPCGSSLGSDRLYFCPRPWLKWTFTFSVSSKARWRLVSRRDWFYPGKNLCPTSLLSPRLNPDPWGYDR